MGRPSKFTIDRRERFLMALRAGVFPETAARYAGWSPATLYRILRATSPEYVAFRDEVGEVETELELRLAGTITQAAFHDPRLALSLLERRFGERWGRRAGQLVPSDEPSAADPQAGETVVIEPALIQAIVPALLAARLGDRGTPEAIRRVGQFAHRAEAGDDD